MKLTEKLNIKLFLALSLSIHLASLFFARSYYEVFIFTFIYLTVLLNFYFMISVINEIILSIKNIGSLKSRKLKMTGFFTGKIISLLLALVLGIHFMGDRVIIPLLNYIIQIFVLGITMKRKD